MPAELARAPVFQYGEFDVPALCRLASKLRGGRPCFCDSTQTPACGSFNWTITIDFTDGVEWVLRSPRSHGGIRSEETNRSLLASEAATLKYIGANSAIPVPQVFAYSRCGDNDIGIPYILMAKAHGLPLQRRWSLSDETKTSMTQDQKAKIVFQLGVITWQLSRLCFDQAGSLFEVEGHFQIQTCLSRGLLLDERDSIEDLDRGPFATAKAYFDAHVSAFFEHIKYLPLGHHCFFAPIPAQEEYDDYTAFRKATDYWNDFVTVQSKIDGSDNRTDYVIVGEAISRMTTTLMKDKPISLPGDYLGRFPLHHPDLSVDNIFVDDEFNITCIIDWAFCSSVPMSTLLTAPGLPQSRHELNSSLLPAFENGFRFSMQKNVLHGNTPHEDRLSRMLSRSSPMWLLTRLLNLDSTMDYHIFKALWNGDASDGLIQDIPEYFRSKQRSEQYIMLRAELGEEDEAPEKMAKLEKDYFRDDVSALAIARKLTLVSRWSSKYHGVKAHDIRGNGDVFIADRRLWKWIDGCLNN